MFKRASTLVVSALALVGTQVHAAGFDALTSAVSATDIVAAFGAVAVVAVAIIIARNGFRSVLGMIRGTAK